MRLSDQRRSMLAAIDKAGCELLSLRAGVLRKIASPYGDGSRSEMVNASTDVLPQLSRILIDLRDAMQQIDPLYDFDCLGIRTAASANGEHGNE